MTTVIHAELDALCLLILGVIAYQVATSVSQQMGRRMFRALIYGIMVNLALDIVWVLVDGQMFPGSVVINKVTNAVYLGLGVVLACLWYLYVLETLGFRITKLLHTVVMLPGAFFMGLNIISIFTGWVFTVFPENVYAHGQLFWLQDVGVLTMMFVPLIHIIVRLIDRRGNTPRWVVWRLLLFYALPVIATLLTIWYTGLPGAWTSAAVSIVIMYIDEQDREVEKDSLTGLNNRKTLKKVFESYVRQDEEDEDFQVYLFMMDLDGFKEINDTYGHHEGDKALVATAKILRESVAGMKAYIARFGGDEFMVMSFFRSGDEVLAYRAKLTEMFRAYNEREKPPYQLKISIGFSPYEPGQGLEELTEAADRALYEEKRKNQTGRRTGARRAGFR